MFLTVTRIAAGYNTIRRFIYIPPFTLEAGSTSLAVRSRRA